MKTILGSLKNYQKGEVELINDNAKNYVFSNLFETANHAKPYEKIAAAKNFKYVIEVLRAEGVSPWFLCNHDEFALLMDGEVQVEFIKPNTPIPQDNQGTHILEGKVTGSSVGKVFAKTGHMVLLPKQIAYRFTAKCPGVLLLQTIQGEHTVEKWAEICTK